MIISVTDMLLEPKMTKICAPMVRYSKLQFRSLVRTYNCDLCFTPMIMADSFVKSHKARECEFSTNSLDRPLVVQFAANNVEDFLGASEMIASYADGVDLNCGCPQRWAMKDGYGAHLLSNPQLVKDLVYRARNTIPEPFSVSVKIRILRDLKKSIELCQALEHAGVSFLTVHARTPEMRNEPIDLESLKIVRDSVKCPVIANGNVKSLDEAKELYKESRCDGVMAASAILTNPALFSGHSTTPLECVQDWLNIVYSMPMNFTNMHHHFIFMLEKIMPKKERLIFNTLTNEASVYEFLERTYGMTPRLLEDFELTNCVYKTTQRATTERKEEEDSTNLDLDNLFS